MIELIEGRGVGSGKSYMVMERLLPIWMRGGTSYVSDTVEVKWEGCEAFARDFGGVQLQREQYQSIKKGDVHRLHEVTRPGTADNPVLIVVDEAQDELNARDWADKGKRGFFSWLCQSRHDDNHVLIISQAVANVDKQIRRLCTFIWITRNTEFFPIGSSTLAKTIRLFTLGLNDGKYFIRTQLDQDGRTQLGSKKWSRANKRLFGCYNSKSMRMAKQRAGAEIGRLELVKVEKNKPMMKYVVVAALLLSGVMLYRVVTGKAGATTGKVTNANAKSISPQQSSAKAGPSVSIVRNTLLSVTPGTLVTEENGEFVKGEICPLGKVEGIKGNIVRVRPLEGGTVYVIAERRGLRGQSERAAVHGSVTMAPSVVSPTPAPIVVAHWDPEWNSLKAFVPIPSTVAVANETASKTRK
jgi:hypothetical protein